MKILEFSKKINRGISIRLEAIFKFKKTINKYKIGAILDKLDGEITLEEASFLGELVRGIDSDGPIIEIGTHLGYSSTIMAMNKKNTMQLITVDNYSWNSLFLDSQSQFDLTNKLLKDLIDNCNVHQKNIEKDLFYSQYIGECPSLVFLDADHSYEETKKDILWAKKIGAGIICGHDYFDEYPGVIKAVNEMGGCKELFQTLWVLDS